MLFLPDDGFEPELRLGDGFLADSLFEPEDCVLTDVSLSDALQDRRGWGSGRSCLQSDGDSYPNSPIHELEDSLADRPPVKEEPAVKEPGVKEELGLVIKQEPGVYLPAQSVLRQPAIVFRSRATPGARLLCPKLVVVKSEPVKSEPGEAYCRPARPHTKSSSRAALESCLLSSSKLSAGELSLTEEEKRTLLSEGYPVPARLPLSKAEERSLKKIRRKIKNKISAQESRRKKKEYLDQLELRCERAESERDKWRSRCSQLETTNRALQRQLAELQDKMVAAEFKGASLDIDVD